MDGGGFVVQVSQIEMDSVDPGMEINEGLLQRIHCMVCNCWLKVKRIVIHELLLHLNKFIM